MVSRNTNSLTQNVRINCVVSKCDALASADAEDYSSVVEETTLANGCCPGCGEKGQSFEGDHGSPKSRGGLGLQIICKACNRTKSDKFGFSKRHMRMHAKYRRAKKLGTLFEEGFT